MTDVFGPLDSGPNWGVMTDRDVLERARDLPVGYGEMVSSTIAESFITSSGLGTAIRDANIPDSIPSRDVVTPPELDVRDPMAVPRLGQEQPFRVQPPPGTWLETEDEYQTRRKRAGALSKDEWQASPNFRTGIPYDPGMTQDRASALASWYDASKVRQDTIARGPGGFLGTSLWLGGMVLGSAPDPVNYIPIFGPEVRAAQVAKFGRLGGSVLTSAADAMLNTAATSALTAGTRASFGDDVTWQGWLTDIAIGAVIGGAFGAATSKWEGWQTSRTANKLERVVEARRALNDVIHDVVHDRPVEITPAVQDAVEKAAVSDPFAKETAALFQNGDKVGPRPLSLTQFIARNGGLALDGEARARDFDKVNVPGAGRLAREGGRTIDGYWREALIENGYFPKDADGYASRDMTAEILDALDGERRGKKHFAPEDIDRTQGQAKRPEIDREVEKAAKAIVKAHEEQGIKASELDQAALYDAADRMFKGEETDPFNAYERAVTDAANRPQKAQTNLTDEDMSAFLDDTGWDILPRERMAAATPQPITPDRAATEAASRVGRPAKTPSEEFGIDLKPVKPPAEPPKKTVKAVRGEDGRISGLEIDNGATADLAKQFGINMKTGDFPEMAEFDQLVAQGRVTPEEMADVQKAMQLEVQSDAYAKALEAAAICRVGS